MNNIFIVILFLSFVDITLTFKTTQMYRTFRPYDDKWYEQELSSIPRKILQKFGCGLKSFIIAISFSFSVLLLLFFIGVRIKLPIEIFYIFVGMFIIIIQIHFYNISALEKAIKNKWDVPI